MLNVTCESHSVELVWSGQQNLHISWRSFTTQNFKAFMKWLSLLLLQVRRIIMLVWQSGKNWKLRRLGNLKCCGSHSKLHKYFTVAWYGWKSNSLNWFSVHLSYHISSRCVLSLRRHCMKAAGQKDHCIGYFLLCPSWVFIIKPEEGVCLEDQASVGGNIKMALKEMGLEGVDQIHLGQDMVHWQFLVNIIMNLCISQSAGIFLIRWASVMSQGRLCFLEFISCKDIGVSSSGQAGCLNGHWPDMLYCSYVSGSCNRCKLLPYSTGQCFHYHRDQWTCNCRWPCIKTRDCYFPCIKPDIEYTVWCQCRSPAYVSSNV